MVKERLVVTSIVVDTDRGQHQHLAALVDPKLLSTYMQIGSFVARGSGQRPGEKMVSEDQTSFLSYDQQAVLNAIGGTAREVKKDSKRRSQFRFNSSTLCVGRVKSK